MKEPFYGLMMTARALFAPTVMGVAGAVFDAGGRVLLIRQSYTRGWLFPGGGVDRHEAPTAALMRELHEEVGLQGGTAEFFGLYTRKAGWATNVIALYRVTGGSIDFKPSWEVRQAAFFDPLSPPDGTTGATRRRLQELMGALPKGEHWQA